MKFRQLIIAVLLRTVVSLPYTEVDPEVSVGDLGVVQGTISKTRNTGRPFLQFRGIPYALPPVGDKRFMPSELNPGPLTSDGSPFNASSFGSPCPQAAGGSEDCLFLNIAAPINSLRTGELVPVIVYIHGAAFVRGSANKFDGQLLLREDLVVVSFNYRLGVFGYFGLSSDLAPGNAGLYDALTALRWVQKYITFFGGDPNLVTLAGQSSGSASVTHLLLSPLSRGLFHRAIALSGTALNAWGTTANPVPAALRIARWTGCYDSNQTENVNPVVLQETVDCMKKAPVKTLLEAQDKFQTEERASGRHGFDAVNPSITFDRLKSTPTLLPDFPINILKQSSQMDVPLILGATKQDGEFSLGFVYSYFLVPNKLLNDSKFLREELVPTMIRAAGYHPGEYESRESFASTYLKKCKDSGNFTQMLPGLTDISTVLFFKAAALQLAELHSKRSPTFLYSFDFKGTRTQHHPRLPFKGGVAHSDDTIYLFPVQDFEFNYDEARVSKNMISIWTNFAKTGSPESFSSDSEISWPAFNAEEGNYAIIDKDVTVDRDYKAKWVEASRDVFGNYTC